MTQSDSTTQTSPVLTVRAEPPASGFSSVSAAPAASSVSKEVPARITSVKNTISQAADTVKADTVKADTVASGHVYGIMLTPPVVPKAERNESATPGMSYIIGGLILLFCVICLRMRSNRKYVSALMKNLVEVRVRSNVFDETVRETSFLVLLNLLWSCSAGILLYGVLVLTTPGADTTGSFSIPALRVMPAASIGICMGVGVAYTCFMALAYTIVGAVFSDGVHARMWLKGFTASQGLMSFIYFILALLFICNPEWVERVLWTALGTFIIAKIVFIWKGFRIFFTQISSWVLFLYYLCSLEIVPLILTYLAAILLTGLLH